MALPIRISGNHKKPDRPNKGLFSRRENKNSDLDDFMVIGIDFGTTYSGAAWATIADFERDQINLVSSWPGTGREEGKAPTELFYEHEDLMWGYTIPADAEPIRWFKLLLLREEDLDPELREAEFILRGRKMLRDSGKTATDLIADYLGALWKHILDTIQRARGRSVIEALAFHVVITVPAIWKDYAREGMKKAAKQSGILDSRPAGRTTLAFAPEPEAAALISLCESAHRISTGDVYLICDAGGGTVDLTSYKVGNLEPIALDEAVIGTGGLCGGIFIDEAFENMCRSRLGRQWSRLSQTGVKDIMKNEWEYAIKPQFKLDSTMSKEYIVAVPAEAFDGSNLNDETRRPIIKNGRIHFASSDIRKAFTNVFSSIEDLVDGQISKVEEKKHSVTGILLVGGLGSSPYLYEYLNNKYTERRIDVLQATGMRPRTAICRGAVLKGFIDAPTAHDDGDKQNFSITSPISVVSYVARASLGVRGFKTFDGRVHPEKDKVWNEELGIWEVWRMKWYIHKGDNVSKLKPVVNKYYYTFTEDDYDGSFKVRIWQCYDDCPPAACIESVRKLCKIRCEIDEPFKALKDFTTPTGKKLKWFHLERRPSST